MKLLALRGWWVGSGLVGVPTLAAWAASAAPEPVSGDDLLTVDDALQGESVDQEEGEEPEGDEADLWLLVEEARPTPSELLLGSVAEGAGASLGEPLPVPLPGRLAAAAARWVPQLSIEARATWGSAAGAREGLDGAVSGWLTATWVPGRARSAPQAAAWEALGLWVADAEDASGLRLAKLSRTERVARMVTSLAATRAKGRAVPLDAEASLVDHVAHLLELAEWEALHGPVPGHGTRGGS